MVNARIAGGLGHVLLVEDEPIIAMEIEFTLEELGVGRVSLAVSQAEAQSVIREGGVDAALVDLMLGREDGRTVMAELQAQGIPFAILTGMDPAAATDKAFPGVPVLTKPFLSRDLEAVLEKLC